MVDSSYIRDYPAPPAEGYNGKERSNIELEIDVMKASNILTSLVPQLLVWFLERLGGFSLKKRGKLLNHLH